MSDAQKIVVYNFIILLLYWGVTHLNWLILSSVGVLPMPIWPAAAVSLVAALYLGWRASPGIAAGSFLANWLVVDASFDISVCVPITNTLASIAGAYFIQSKVSSFSSFSNVGKAVQAMLLCSILPPLISALGATFWMYLWDARSLDMLPVFFTRWFMAHSIGIVMFALPYLVWTAGRDSR